mgnify:CR=1 FL=1
MLRKLFGYHGFAKGTIIRLRAKLTFKEFEVLAKTYKDFGFIRSEFKTDITIIEGYANDFDMLREFQDDLKKAIVKSKITYLAEGIGFSEIKLVTYLDDVQSDYDDLPF